MIRQHFHSSDKGVRRIGSPFIRTDHGQDFFPVLFLIQVVGKTDKGFEVHFGQINVF
jgi:hypothetical protein